MGWIQPLGSPPLEVPLSYLGRLEGLTSPYIPLVSFAYPKWTSSKEKGDKESRGSVWAVDQQHEH